MSAAGSSERIAGSLYGLLVGDALGCPVEGWTRARIRQTHGVLSSLLDSGARRPRGLHSDDGQQALLVCDAVLEDARRPSAALARDLVRLWSEGPRGSVRFGAHRGTGRNLRQAVRAIAAKGGPFEGALPTAGPGTAMRVAPLALYHRGALERLRAAVLDVSLVTHTDVRGIAAAGALAVAVVCALEDVEFDMLAFVEDLELEAAARLKHRGDPHVFSRSLSDVVERLGEPLDEVLARIADNANRTATRRGGAAAAYCLASVNTAIYLGLMATTFESALVTAVNLGEDADTVGAMAGAVAGARHGAAAIPAAWYDALWARDALGERIAALRERRTHRPAPDAVELEIAWTREMLRRGYGREGHGRR